MRGMGTFCPTRWMLGIVVVGVSGCTGQNLEGAWRGPFPLEKANDCRTRLYQDGTFDLSCRDRSSWKGVGRWKRKGQEVELVFSLLGEGEKKALQLPTVRFRLTGRGNEIELEETAGRNRYVWRRTMGE